MRRLSLLLIACLISASSLSESPNPVIEEAAVLLDEAVRGRREELAVDKEVLYTLINVILLPRFDRKYAAQLVLARHWRTASEEEREQFTDAFYNHLMRLYADAVLEFDLEKLTVLPYRSDDTKKRTTVKTTMLLDDGTEVPVNYGMVKRDSGWLMFDVTIEGISYIRNFKVELNSEIQAKGLSGVIERLEADANGGASE